jgi:DNA-binding NtrC family response regulator
MKNRVLIIDDDTSLAEALTGLLSAAGYDVKSAETGDAALDIVRNEPIALALLDLRLGAESGLDLLPQLKTIRPELSVIMISGVGTIEVAVEAMRRSADNFITKPVDPPRLLATVVKGIESRRLRHKQAQLQRLVPPVGQFVCGEGRAMRESLQLAEMVAPRETTVLLSGETGTGKGLLARFIHDASPRQREPFVELNCAGLQRDLTESELFGHERGAFTGAVEKKIGLFEAADSGTLFLDEIGEMDLAVQAKLLNVLERKRFRRVGGLTEIEVDVRLIAATHRDLARNVAEGRFREDLFFRLNVFTIELPPLRERREDIVPLAQHFLREFHTTSVSVPEISPDADTILHEYDWPGNVRELRNVIERASILCPPGSDILPAHLPPLGASRISNLKSQMEKATPTVDRAASLEEAERQHLEASLKAHDWNVQATAEALGIARGTLYRKIEKYQLSPR